MRIYTGTLQLEPGTENAAVVDVYRRSLRLRTAPSDAAIPGSGYKGETGRHPMNDDRGAGANEYNRNGNAGDDVYGDRSNGNGNNVGGYNDERGNGGTSEHNAEEGYGSFPHGRGGGNNTDGAIQNNTLSQRDMDDLAVRIKGRITDTDKEQLLKNVLSNRSAYTEQVRQILSWFSFDSSRARFCEVGI